MKGNVSRPRRKINAKLSKGLVATVCVDSPGGIIWRVNNADARGVSKKNT